MGYVMTANEFIEKLILAERNKSLYVKGGFGAPATSKSKTRYANSCTYNKNRKAMIDACTQDTFFFDCCGLLKGILWGFCADMTKVYGGAVYKSNGVPDFGDGNMLCYCHDVSTDFSNIVPGEVLWMQGHVAAYIGDGMVIESSPKWKNGVQITYLANIGYDSGNCRIWNRHGKLDYVDYTSSEKKDAPAKTDNSVYHTVSKGDTLSGIGKKYGVAWKSIAEINNIKWPYIIKVGQTIKIK